VVQPGSSGNTHANNWLSLPAVAVKT